MISAKEAREIAGAPLEKVLAKLNIIIRNAAAKGQTSIRVPYDHCIFHGYSARFKNPEVNAKLVELGYNVTTQSEDRQFVDVWIEVSWA
jgi:hypothetical protein